MSLLNDMLNDLNKRKARTSTQPPFIPMNNPSIITHLIDYIPWILAGSILVLFVILLSNEFHSSPSIPSLQTKPMQPITHRDALPTIAVMNNRPLPSKLAVIPKDAFASNTMTTDEPLGSDEVKKRFVSLSPDEWHAEQLNKALAAIEDGEDVQAIYLLQLILERIPTAMDARESLAALYLAHADYAEAIKLINDGLLMQPDAQNLQTIKAQLLFEQDKPSEALALLNRFQPTIQDDPDFYGLKAAILQTLGRFNDAGSIYKTLVDIEPSNGQYWLGFALSLENKQAIQQAITAYKRASQSYDLEPTVRAFAEDKLKQLQG